MSKADEWKRRSEEKAREKVADDNASKPPEKQKQIDRVIVSDPEVVGAGPRIRLKVRILYKDGTEECFYYFPDTDDLWPTAC